MRKHSFVLLVLVACSSGPRLPSEPRGEVVLEVRGAVKHGPYRRGQLDLEALPRHRLFGVDPAPGREAEYEGPALSTHGARMKTARTGAGPRPSTCCRR